MPFSAQADKTAHSFLSAVEVTLPSLSGWWRDSDLSGKLIWELSCTSSFTYSQSWQRSTSEEGFSACPSHPMLHILVCPVHGDLGLPHPQGAQPASSTGTLACPIHSQPSLLHAQMTLSYSISGDPSLLHSWGLACPVQEGMAVVGCTPHILSPQPQQEEKNIILRTKKCLSAQCQHPIAQAEVKAHSVSWSLWLCWVTVAPRAKMAPVPAREAEVAVEPSLLLHVHTAAGRTSPLALQPPQPSMAMPPGQHRPSLPLLPTAFNQTTRFPKTTSFYLIPERLLLSDTCS